MEGRDVLTTSPYNKNTGPPLADSIAQSLPILCDSVFRIRVRTGTKSRNLTLRTQPWNLTPRNLGTLNAVRASHYLVPTFSLSLSLYLYRTKQASSIKRDNTFFLPIMSALRTLSRRITATTTQTRLFSSRLSPAASSISSRAFSVSAASMGRFDGVEPSAPSVKTEIPGPKAKEQIADLDKVFDTRSLNMLTDYTQSIGNYIADPDGNKLLDV